MRAVRFHHKRDIRWDDIAPPQDKLKDNDVLVRPILCGICGTDLHEYVAGPIVTPTEPHLYTGAKLPQVLGHEFSAEVLDVGAKVNNVRPGDRVSIQPLVSPRDDYYGRRGLYHLSEKMGCIGLSWEWGGMAERAVVNDYNVFKVSNTVSDVQAAMIEPAAVALYGVDRGGVQAGSTVLVSGLGPIGALTLLACRAAGASVIVVAEINPHRRELAKSLAPNALVLDPKTMDVAEFVKDHTEEGVGVDVALECVGLEVSLNNCAKAVRRRGTVVQVGLHTRRASVDAMLWALKDITIEATWCYPTTIWPRIAGMIAAGLYPVEKIVTATIDPENVVADGFEELLDPSGRNMKILVRAS
jgi:(R,R)-butanediol dehydrogenase / meso-butanediol dehydrogenase / diacetyl reductase